MPIGVISNALSVAVGGMVGAFAGNKLSARFKEDINMIFGACSMGMGISAIVLMENMPAVIFGTAIGLAIHLGDKMNAAAGGMQKVVSKFVKNKNSKISEEEFTATLVTIIVLFCASGTGIYGSIISGMTGDHSILIARQIHFGFVYSFNFCLHVGNGGIYSSNSAVCYIPAPVLMCRIDLSCHNAHNDQ